MIQKNYSNIYLVYSKIIIEEKKIIIKIIIFKLKFQSNLHHFTFLLDTNNNNSNRN